MESIVYIGDFDLRNRNVQSHLVLNNGRIFSQLGYSVSYIGTNRDCLSFSDLPRERVNIEDFQYYELPHTLTLKGIFQVRSIKNRILHVLDEINNRNHVKYLITYQCPSYAIVLEYIIKWCRKNHVKYIVNSADITVFDSQPFFKRVMMELNWNYLHRITKKNANGIKAVSRYIADFYYKADRASIIVPPLFYEERIMRARNNIEKQCTTFVYAGTPFPLLSHCVNPDGMKDRLDKIIHLFSLVEENRIQFKLYVIGLTLDDFCLAVPQYSEYLKKTECISFFGRKDHDITLDFVEKADFLINYRDKNVMNEAGLSTKVVESISLGTPIVMNDIGDTFQYLNETMGIKLSGTIDKDVETIIRLCKMKPEEISRIKEYCKSNSPFKVDAYIEQYKAFFEKLNSN